VQFSEGDWARQAPRAAVGGEAEALRWHKFKGGAGALGDCLRFFYVFRGEVEDPEDCAFGTAMFE
jgi:hypothetical protein